MEDGQNKSLIISRWKEQTGETPEQATVTEDDLKTEGQVTVRTVVWWADVVWNDLRHSLRIKTQRDS